MNRLAVINVVGLTEALIGEHTPRIAAFRKDGSFVHINPAFPAVTCTAQSNYLTGKTPMEHGIVGNGWYNRELAEIQFWKQSNHVVQGEKIWDVLRARARAAGKHDFTAANCFWWYNMYSSVDYSITPRPMYPADGRKFFDVYSWPYSIRTEVKRELGEFPFFGFWGPAAGVDSPQGNADAASRWIANSSKWIETKYSPALNLIYLPHLDYNLQRHGPYTATGVINPRIHRDLHEIDAIVGDLLDFFSKRGVQPMILSEYGITNVDTPVHLNRLFREQGWLTIKEELGLEILDGGNSQVFAAADHQVAHVYVKEPSLKGKVRSLLDKTDGIGEVMEGGGGRFGDLVVVAKPNAWFTYYYWLDDRLAPDFARTVDIHRKAGYDPVELFLDPAIKFPKLKIARRLLQKKLGFRMLMDVIPLDATMVKGSHGRCPEDRKDWPVLMTGKTDAMPARQLESTDVFQLLLRLVGV